MFLPAASLGYRPTTIRACRSKRRSSSLKRKIRAVASPISVKGSRYVPLRQKCAAHRSRRGLKKRTKRSVPGTKEPTSLPLCTLQSAQANARLSATVAPPCLTLTMCSTWQPSKVSASAMRQYSQIRPARIATVKRNFRLTHCPICEILARTGFCQPHDVFQF